MISGTFYTLGETADILHKNRLTIRRWIRDGKIEAMRCGNLVLIRENEVLRLQATQAFSNE